MYDVTIGKISPFLAAHYGVLPKGPVLFLGVGDGTEIVHLAKRGYLVSALEQNGARLEHAQTLAAATGVKVLWHHQERSLWRLGFEKWAGIVALFPEWSTNERRRVMATVPNALMPGGSFLFEGYAEGPDGPQSLSDDELDPVDFRAEIDVLHLARFATVSPPAHQTTRSASPTWLLQVVGTHLSADDESARLAS
jgi:hypothetical protein